MIAAIINKLCRVPARQLNLLMIGIVLAITMLLWLSIRLPVASLRMMQAERTRLETTGAPGIAVALEIQQLEDSLAVLKHSLGKIDANGFPDNLLVEILGEVDRIAARHGVLLSGAAPGPMRTTMLFTEIPFDFDARGSYQSLMRWMAEIERMLQTLAIVRFEMQVSESSPDLKVKLRIAAYRSIETSP